MSKLLLDATSFLLLDGSSDLLLDGEATTTTETASSPGGSKNFDPHPETQAFWESERERLRILQDDEDWLLI